MRQGGLFQLDDGRWVARLDLGWEGGKRKRQEGRFKTQREALKALDRWRRDHEDGLPLPSERRTVGAFLADWLENTARPTVRPKTYESYAQPVRLHLAPGLGRIALAKLTPQDVQELLNAKLASGRSPRTVQYLRAVIRRALGQALKWGMVPRNVATLVDPPRSKRQEVEPLTEAQARGFLAAVEGDRLETLYTVAIALDLRHSAASLLLAQGEQLRDIMELLGHSQISITADLYARVAQARKRRMADRMDAVLRKHAQSG